jgi:hypothetical protein
MKKALAATVSVICLLAACSEIPGKAYFNRGDPENLLDVSSEVVTLGQGQISQLSNMIVQDPPARAELGCSASDSLCTQAKKILDKHNIPAQYTGNGSGVTLVYERIMARDCENRFIDNSINPYNMNHPTFGCSITGNMVQMVSDKRQFVNPSLLDLADGEKTVQVYRAYEKPVSPNSSTNWTTGSSTAGTVGGR